MGVLIKRKLCFTTVIIVLAGCEPQAEQSQGNQPFGPEWKAKQASHVKACTAKGYSAATCEQTNPADEYTNEFRRSILKHGVAIDQCLNGSAEACGRIQNEDVGPCMSFASEVTSPSDDEYKVEQKEVCLLTLQIIRDAGQP